MNGLMRPWSCRGRATPTPPCLSSRTPLRLQPRPAVRPPSSLPRSAAAPARPPTPGNSLRSKEKPHELSSLNTPARPFPASPHAGTCQLAGFSCPGGGFCIWVRGWQERGPGPASSPRPPSLLPSLSFSLSLSAPETPILILMENSRFLKAKLLSSGFPLALC